MSDTTVDSVEFARTGESRSGVVSVASLGRLSAELADTSGELQWTITGGRHAIGAPQLNMQVKGEVTLVCQRCLAPFAHVIATDTVLVLARDEADADETEEKLDDDSIDVIVGDARQDLLQLVEDDALLALPLSPRHDTCPGDAPAVPQDKRESPFAALKGLKN
ncbi:MAG: hypothetical protein RL404_2369 [Pseudomonadota bacterium]|jgi:uncharacterized protein